MQVFRLYFPHSLPLLHTLSSLSCVVPMRGFCACTPCPVLLLFPDPVENLPSPLPRTDFLSCVAPMHLSRLRTSPHITYVPSFVSRREPQCHHSRARRASHRPHHAPRRGDARRRQAQHVRKPMGGEAQQARRRLLPLRGELSQRSAFHAVRHDRVVRRFRNGKTECEGSIQFASRVLVKINPVSLLENFSVHAQLST